MPFLTAPTTRSERPVSAMTLRSSITTKARVELPTNSPASTLRYETRPRWAIGSRPRRAGSWRGPLGRWPDRPGWTLSRSPASPPCPRRGLGRCSPHRAYGRLLISRLRPPRAAAAISSPSRRAASCGRRRFWPRRIRPGPGPPRSEPEPSAARAPSRWFS